MTQDEINAVKKAAAKMRKENAMQDEIIGLARQAGLIFHALGNTPKELEAFAKLVEDAAFKRWVAQTKLAVQDEREACANLVFNSVPSDEYESPLMAVYNAIRARGEA